MDKVLSEPAPEPVSLNSLKKEIKEEIKSVRTPEVLDRAASAEDMNKLKDLIKEKMENKKEETTPAKATPPSKGGEQVSQKLTTKEVPEDVLRKILE